MSYRDVIRSAGADDIVVASAETRGMALHLRATRVASPIAVVLLAAGTTLLGAPVAHAGSASRVDHCVWPATGADLQEFWGISSYFVAPGVGCDHVAAGAAWTTPVSFYVAKTWEHVPDGVVPATDSPLAELESSVTTVRLIVDQGTKQQFTVERSGDQLQWKVREWDAVYQEHSDWYLVDVGTALSVHPLAVGTHTVTAEIVADRVACDGTDPAYDVSCLPPGVWDYPTRTFQVVAHG